MDSWLFCRPLIAHPLITNLIMYWVYAQKSLFRKGTKKIPVYKTWQMYYFEANENLFWIAFMNSKYFFLLNSIFYIILAYIFTTLTFCLVPRSITRTDKGYCSKSIPRQVWTKQQHAKIHLRHWQCPYQVFNLGDNDNFVATATYICSKNKHEGPHFKIRDGVKKIVWNRWPPHPHIPR